MYTLSIAMAARLFVVCFDLGAQAERVRAWGWGQAIGPRARAGGDQRRPAGRRAARPAGALPHHRAAAGQLSSIFSCPITISRPANATGLSAPHSRQAQLHRPSPHSRSREGPCTYLLASPPTTCPRRRRWPIRSSGFTPRRFFTSSCATGCRLCPGVTTEPSTRSSTSADLPIEKLPSWIFKHRLVELCTAVKGTAFQYIAERFGAERIYYFDPDIVVLGRLDDLERMLDRNSVLLTPHLLEPETDLQAILDNEICCLRHGVYNLGFWRCG